MCSSTCETIVRFSSPRGHGRTALLTNVGLAAGGPLTVVRGGAGAPLHVAERELETGFSFCDGC